jgi:hypothetical protein
MEFCNSDAECAAPGGLCIVTLDDGMGGAIPGATLCTENCDPTTNIGCPVTGTGCGIGQEPGGQMRLLTMCGEVGGGLQGVACTTNADCAATYTCINTGQTTECLKWCKIGGAACPGGLTCVEVTIDSVPIEIGNQQYGVCF